MLVLLAFHPITLIILYVKRICLKSLLDYDYYRESRPCSVIS